MPTGDGIQRVTTSESLLTPSGGEGGSVPQALGSKAEERAKRRKTKKDSYAKYLDSSTWRKIRARALKRDKSKCRACGEMAQHVHHIRYPKNLGEEKMEWLYSLCVSCHDEIHRRCSAKGVTLRAATNDVLGVPRKPKKLTKAQRRKAKGAPLPKNIVARRQRRSKKDLLAQENDHLRETFRLNRERRERRWNT